MLKQIYQTAGLGAILTLGLLFGQTANAGFVMTLDDLNDSSAATVINDSSSLDLSTLAGVITYSGSIGVFSVNVTTGVSKPILSSGVLNLNSIDVNGASPGTLRVGITDTDFTGDFSELIASFGGVTRGTINFSFLLDSNNAEFGGTAFASSSFTASGPANFSFSNDIVKSFINSPTPYSLTILADITHASPFQSTTFDARITPTAVPEPSAFVLYLSSLVGLFMFGRKKLFRKS